MKRHGITLTIHGKLIASTSRSNDQLDPTQAVVLNLGSSKIPWDGQALQWTIQHPHQDERFSDVTYQGQHIRVYTTLNDFTTHIIQTARSTQDIEQSLNNLRQVLINGTLLVLLLTLSGSLIISGGVLISVRRLTTAAQTISTSRDLSKRVHYPHFALGRDELTILADTFNQMLSSLEDMYQRQQRFIADASHELRAPITSIRCNLDLLARAPDLPAEEAQGALHDARSEAARMGRLVNDLLQLARMDSDNNPYPDLLLQKNYKKNLAVIDLDSLLLAVFRQYHPREESTDDNDHGPRLLLQHIAPARVRGEEDQLKQALVALLDNALKYTPREGYVSLSLTADNHTARVTVNDSGIGIFPTDLPHIFERFYRADHARSRDRGGSGLGLAIAQGIAHEHHGSIEVNSIPGKGSTFTLALPLSP